MTVNSILCSVPVETPGGKLRRQRSEGPTPIMPKIAITSINNWTEKNNFPTCKFYDIDMLYPDDEQIKKFFENNHADVVGLSAVVSTSYLQVKRISKIIKEVNPGALIVCGGYLTAASNTVLHKTDVDICVVGDGEMAWVGILKHLEKNKNTNKKFIVNELLKIKGIAVLNDNNEIEFSGYGHTLSSCHMSFPSFDYLKTGLQGNDEAVQNYFRPYYKTEEFLMDDRSYNHKRIMVSSIHVSKGCVAKCTFCQRGAKGYTVYNLDDLEKHLIQLKKYNVGFLMVDDENFGSNKKYTYEVAKLFHKHEMLWSCSGVRCTSVNKDDLKFYKDHGCVSLKFGIESGSQTMLDLMEKRFTVEDIKKALFSCYEIDLYSPPLGFMVGMPGESLETAKASGKLLGEIAAKLRVPIVKLFGYTDLFYAIPLVGTPLYDYGKKLGLIGSTLDEEEAYLKLVSNVGAYKRYYINFNGAPMSEVVFWDILVFLEATKVYKKLMKNKKLNQKMIDKLNSVNKTQMQNPNVKSKYTEKKGSQIFGGGGGDEKTHNQINRYFITDFIRKKVALNERLASIPRFILYPLVRYFLYFEYLLQRFFFKDTNNIHLITNRKVDKKIRIKPEEVDPLRTSQKDRSLRSIIEKRFKDYEKSLSSAEKRVNSLVAGP